MNNIPIKRALFSVSDKSQVVEFARELANLGVELISTGGTAQILNENKIKNTAIESLTGLPEILHGRVKTLHPQIHGAILGRRDSDHDEAFQLGIQWIDLVIVNFYPFTSVIDKQSEVAVEYIDIGGPTMVRAAAKNFAWVAVVVDPADYSKVLTEMHETGGLSLTTRQTLASKAFSMTANYDNMIYQYFNNLSGQDSQPSFPVLESPQKLRYGENPHQKAFAFSSADDHDSLLKAEQLQGKSLSYNNLTDADAACNCLLEFEKPTCVIVKHGNPCGVASSDNIEDAYELAFTADSVSAFGGIVAINRPVTKELARQFLKVFTEVIIAPEYSNEALASLSVKNNLRLLKMAGLNKATKVLPSEWEFKSIRGGILAQEKDQQNLDVNQIQIVTKTKPNEQLLSSMQFGWHVVKHVKSNAIVITNEQKTLGIGAGQVSRIDAVKIALQKASAKTENSVLASDAFFPFRDSIDQIANSGISAIIQPGGSVRDQEVIDACDEHGIVMAFTDMRCFKH